MKNFNSNSSILYKPGLSGLLALVLCFCFVLMTSCSEEGSEIVPDPVSQSEILSKANAGPSEVSVLTSGLMGAAGSTIGPGGDLFVTEGAVGKITRINLRTGEKSTFAEGLPLSIIGIGGVWDVAFIGETAYALVTLNGPQFGGTYPVGIYRIDGPDSYTVIADIGVYTLANPPSTDYFVDMGVQYSIEAFRGGFLVTDGHHNRVYHVTRDGEISDFKTFGNIVPTGLEVRGNTVYMAEAGPVPHLPENGKVVSFSPGSDDVTEIASGSPLLVDVEFNRGQTMYALSQGTWNGQGEGSPALPETGALVRVNSDGTFTVIKSELDIPTSLEFVGNTAYIVTLTGNVLVIHNVGSAPFGI